VWAVFWRVTSRRREAAPEVEVATPAAARLQLCGAHLFQGERRTKESRHNFAATLLTGPHSPNAHPTSEPNHRTKTLSIHFQTLFGLFDAQNREILFLKNLQKEKICVVQKLMKINQNFEIDNLFL